jgi:hypothetical protein
MTRRDRGGVQALVDERAQQPPGLLQHRFDVVRGVEDRDEQRRCRPVPSGVAGTARRRREARAVERPAVPGVHGLGSATTQPHELTVDPTVRTWIVVE